MKLETVSTIGRIILTLALIFASYKETGFFTALALFFIFMSIEASSALRKHERENF